MLKLKINKIVVCISILVLMLTSSAPALYRKSPERSPYYHYILGRIYIHQSKITKAVESLERAVRLDPDSWVVRWDLLELYYITGAYYKGRELAIKMYGMRPEDPQLLEILADIYSKTNEPDKALDMYNKLLKITPDNHLIRLSIASIYITKKDYKSALRQYLAVLKHDHKNLYARLAMADVYMELGEYETSVKNYLEALKFGGDPHEINLQVAKIYKHMNKYSLAERYLNKNLEINPEDLQTLFLLADVYQDSGKYKKAEEVLLNIKDLTQDYIGALLSLGTLYSEMNEIDKAVEVFEEVTNKYPKNNTGWYLLGITHEYQGRYELAKNALLEAHKLNEDDQILFHLGVVYDKLGQKEGSYKKFKECLQMNPKNAGAYNYLGYTWAEKGVNLDEAEQYILKALKIEPDNAAFTDSLGWVYYKQGKYNEALEQLKKAASLNGDPVILEHLGDTYMKLGKKGKAGKIYKKALKINPKNKELEKKLEESSK
jgi:tetratricopeptide (TPR) repeat protein